MYRWGRPADPSFRPNERVFMRFLDVGYSRPGHALSVYQILKERLRIPGQSFNRERFGQPTDVLYPRYFDWGILVIPAPIMFRSETSGDNKVYRFQLEHVPLWNNIGHSEIHVYLNNRRLRSQKETTGKVRNHYRESLVAGGANVYRQPS